MKHYRRICDWLFQFASSWENIDRLASRLTWVSVALGVVTIALFIVVFFTGM